MELPSQQKPLEEAAERAAEQAPARGLPFFVGVQDMMASLADHRKRVREGYRAGARALGMEDIVKDGGGEEVPGDISVSGDSVHEHHHYPPGGLSGGGKSLLSKALPYLATAALTAGALNGGEILHSFSSMFKADYEIRFYDKDDNEIDVPRRQSKPDGAEVQP